MDAFGVGDKWARRWMARWRRTLVILTTSLRRPIGRGYTDNCLAYKWRGGGRPDRDDNTAVGDSTYQDQLPSTDGRIKRVIVADPGEIQEIINLIAAVHWDAPVVDLLSKLSGSYSQLFHWPVCLCPPPSPHSELCSGSLIYPYCCVTFSIIRWRSHFL